MDLFLTGIFRWVLATLLLCFIIQKSESAFRISQKPSNPTIVVLGVNSSQVTLVWRYSDAPSQYFVQFWRRKTGEKIKQISSSKDGNAFNPSNTEEFVARLDATLILKNVKGGEEYTYSLFLLDSNATTKDTHAVSIKVVVPPEITIPPEPRPLLTIGKNYTLTCNASGDPLPNITWTKDGIPAEEFNVTGYKLHLTDVKLKDVGSYRCTASNGYGVDASNVSIAGVKCNECEIKTVGITLVSETWKSALNNRESIEFKTLQANLLSEISKVYTKSPVKELYTVAVVDFRSGSVIAKVEMKFGKSVTDPLKPLEDEIKDGKLGAFRVKRELDLNPIPPEITYPPEPKPLLAIGKNHTLTCNASGDPLPNISWTKDGIPVDRFYVTGYQLYLFNVKLGDVGSYRCTASNGYGDATSVSIVGIRCNDCLNRSIGITLLSEVWTSALNNRESIEFKILESKFLSEISSVYTKNPGKQLYTVGLVDLRYSSGSVVAKVELKFERSVLDPLKPLEDEIKDGKLGSFTVSRELDLNPTSVRFTNFTATAVPSTTSRASGAGQSGDRKKQTMLHVIYSTTIFLLLAH